MSRTFEGLFEYAEAVERDYRARIAIYRILEEALAERGQIVQEANDYEVIRIGDVPMKDGWFINLSRYEGKGQERFSHLANRMGQVLMEPLEITLWIPNGREIIAEDLSPRTECAVSDNAKLTLVVAENGVMDNDTGEELFGEELEALLRDVRKFFSNAELLESKQD